MDDLDRKLLNEIQTGFPIAQRPFRDLGVRLDCSEDEILRRTKRLKKQGIIRRIGGNFDSRRLGFTTTLCAAKVADDKIDRFVEVVNQYPEVTHNYLRDYPYNIWFTFVARDSEMVQRYIEDIKEQTGVSKILDLPAVKVFKIRVDFDLS
ncbi:MAG: AsnC family transcriptional regulator [Proteobacteria bacterium]|nr:AsnC family transcriptional regulator [Pseudomonadota bacterium]